MIYLLFLLMFLTLTLKWIFWSIIMFIIYLEIPLSEIKKEYHELFNLINEYRT